MPRIDADTLRKLEKQLQEYERDNWDAANDPSIRFKSSSANYNVHRAKLFVRWLKDDYAPGRMR